MMRSIALVVVLVLGRFSSADEPILTSLDGKTHPLKLSAAGQIEGIAASEIFRIDFAPKESSGEVSDRANYTVRTDWGGQFSATSLETGDNKLKFTSPLIKELAIPISALHGIERDSLLTPIGRRELMKTVAANSTKDVLLIEKDNGTLALVGLFLGVRDHRFLFRWQDADREVEPNKLIALALASATEQPKPARDFVGIIAGNEIVTGKLTTITTDSITVDAPLLGALKIPREKIPFVDFVVGRRTWVSDLTPTEVRETPFFGQSTAMGWQRDASVEGHALRLRRSGRIEEYAKGLGTHARCELIYKLDGKFRTLIGVIGIDAEASARGSAEFIVLADGKEIYRSGVRKADDDPRRIFVPVAGIQSLTLRSDFAPNSLGIAAHADWADLQLIE